ncbi:MAG: bifunctional phosphoserine phosphatase/homoserine phosphotransferase ThrH [Planctomycetes bacterium]|nr:bifunctional phosphoserine phosphatase/homoserine phosphotransferase ThrH [Planctomycetota bacterium]
MDLVCLDLEGVLIPEIWINFAERTGIDALRVTTREIADYDELMALRLGILKEHGLGLPQIQEVIDGMEPMEGARDFLDALRAKYQLVILSDTFYEFGMPFMKKLGMPTLFCHKLDVADDGEILSYTLRQKDPKRKSVEAFKGLNYRVVAAGDSYNDTTMLAEADAGILFKAPDNVIAEFPQFPLAASYQELTQLIASALA